MEKLPVLWVSYDEYSKHKNQIDSFMKNVIVKVENIPGGDYIIGNMIVQRKTVNDFLLSISDRRLWEQLIVMKEIEREKGLTPRLIIEGSWWVIKFRDWSKTSVMMAMESILSDYNIKIVYSPNMTWTYSWMLGILHKKKEETKVDYPLHGWKPSEMSDNEKVEFIVASIPGVGSKLAKNLLKRFGSIAEICKASKEDLMTVEGIGEKKSNEIFHVLHHVWREEDAKSE